MTFRPHNKVCFNLKGADLSIIVLCFQDDFKHRSYEELRVGNTKRSNNVLEAFVYNL